MGGGQINYCRQLRAASGSDDAYITCEEFNRAMALWGIGIPETTTAFFKTMDASGDGQVLMRTFVGCSVAVVVRQRFCV